MKKYLILVVTIIVSIFLFPSCQKEGQYLPKKKITQIEHTNTYTDFLGIEHTSRDRQEWNWNGKLLNNIVCYDGQDNRTDVIFFHYDSKKRFIELSSNAGTFRFIYNGKDLEKIEHYLSGHLDIADEYFFTKEDKNVVEIKRIVYESSKKVEVNPLQFILPENAVEAISQVPDTKGQIYTYKLVWTDGNLTDMTVYYDDYMRMTYAWKYDDKINPYKGLFSEMPNDISALYSTNNVVEATCNSYFVTQATDVAQYQYVYDGKMPIQVEWESTLTMGHNTKIFTY